MIEMYGIYILTLEEVIDIHRLQINRFGGLHDVRDMGLLESAVAVPQVSVGGELVHTSLALMAAAYIFHIIKTHPYRKIYQYTLVL